MRQAIVLALLGIALCQKKNKWNSETADQRLDDVITYEFKARDIDKNGLVTTKEIREYYEAHPNKMSKEGIDFIDKNFNSNGASVDLEGYRKGVKEWLTEKGSVAKILAGVFENGTNHIQPQNVWRKTISSQ